MLKTHLFSRSYFTD